MLRTLLSVVATRGIGGITQAILLVILVRQLGPVDFGFYTLVSTIAGFGMAIFGFGLNTQALRIGTKPNPAAWGNQIIKLRNFTMIFVAISIFCFLRLLDFEGIDVAVLALLFILFETSSGTVEAVLFGLQRTAAAQANLLVRRVLVLFGTLTGILFGLPIIQANGCALILGTLVSGLWTRSMWGQRVALPLVVRGASAYWLPSIFAKLTSLDVIVAQASMPQLAFGVFSASTRVVNTFQLLPNAFLSVFTPHLTREVSRESRFRMTANTLKQLSIGGLAFLAISPLVSALIVFAAGDGYPGLYPISIILISAFILNCVIQILNAYFYAEARPSVVSASSMASVIVGLLAIWSFSTLWDATGAAIGVLLMHAVQLLILGYRFRDSKSELS